MREILARLWTGNEIGQGYHGDEDNGEMSAWYVLSALGLYPLEIGSSRWAVGSPLFERAVVHRPDGDLVVEAPGAADRWYVAGLDVVAGSAGDGAARAVEAPTVEHGDLTGGATLRFAMSGTPTSWGVPASAGRGWTWQVRAWGRTASRSGRGSGPTAAGAAPTGRPCRG